MRTFPLLLAIFVFIAACKKKNSQVDPQHQCLTPTEVKIQHISGQDVNFVLVGTDSTSIGKVAWTIISDEKTVQIETNGKTLVTQNFSKSGNFRVTAIVQTVCNKNITLTRTENFKIEQYQRQWITDIGQFQDSIDYHLAESVNGGCIAAINGWYSKQIISLNATGQLLWKKSLDWEDSKYTVSILTAGDEGYILGTTTNSKRYGLLKISNTGEKIWEKEFYGIPNPSMMFPGDNLRKVISASDGGYVLAGMSNTRVGNNKSSPQKNSASNDTNTAYDIWIVKVDAQGNKQWDKTIGGSDAEYISNIKVTPDGGYLLNCVSNSKISLDKTEDIEGDYDRWLVKINKSGDIEWDRIQPADTYGQMITLADGSIIIEKQSYPTGVGYRKLNSSGRKIWEKEIQGSDATLLPSVKGGFIMFGNLGAYNFIKFNNDGEVQDRISIELSEGLLRPWSPTIMTSSGGLYGFLYSGSNRSIFYVK
ncbi:hypothetical protein [Dyadobacter fermentans]|uniref:Uncharacterized protein n=1 Tax=Dyadobacter fermentans (strain ATCC 700827 / DSM 18053 / CIP 107007 / KCTC 52180 / NS114) TaxID=471854 RepID=C6W2F1_DYAFD|nr:hypothetical protein [Dyadobacter fermentans]ACT92124.1 hypothetical protein Dfer_0869 [Dyadobacter fermentans DSM 18053]